jgi:hypothetical protein
VGERIVLIDEIARKTPISQSSEPLAPLSGKYLKAGRGWVVSRASRITRESGKRGGKVACGSPRKATIGRVRLYRETEG